MLLCIPTPPANGICVTGEGFSNPVKDVLAFVSMDPPDIDSNRVWNDVDLAQHKPGQTLLSCPTAHSIYALGVSPEPDALVRLPPECSDPNEQRKVCELLITPRIGRFIQFKLLSSYDENNEGEEANIDVCALLLRGVLLPDLEALLGQVSEQAQPDPGYQRLHKESTRFSWQGGVFEMVL